MGRPERGAPYSNDIRNVKITYPLDHRVWRRTDHRRARRRAVSPCCAARDRSIGGGPPVKPWWAGAGDRLQLVPTVDIRVEQLGAVRRPQPGLVELGRREPVLVERHDGVAAGDRAHRPAAPPPRNARFDHRWRRRFAHRNRKTGPYPLDEGGPARFSPAGRAWEGNVLCDRIGGPLALNGKASTNGPVAARRRPQRAAHWTIDSGHSASVLIVPVRS